MTLKIYIHPKCSTCQKALKFLDLNKIYAQKIDITQFPPSKEDLQRMLKFYHNDIRKLFNTSGLLYKEMNLKDKLNEMSQEELLNLLETHGMLVKRPFVMGDHIGLVGFKEAQWEALIR